MPRAEFNSSDKPFNCPKVGNNGTSTPSLSVTVIHTTVGNSHVSTLCLSVDQAATVLDNQVWILYRFCVSATIKQQQNWRQHHQPMLHLQSAKIHPPTYTAFQTYNVVCPSFGLDSAPLTLRPSLDLYYLTSGELSGAGTSLWGSFQ
eukprot:1201442-Rhodomonas_salina.1